MLLGAALFFLAAWPAQAQVTGISYTLSPTGEYTLFESDGLLGTDGSSGLANGYFYGGQVGLGFGQYLELSGLYLLGNEFETDFSDLNDAFLMEYQGETQAVLDALAANTELSGREVDLRRVGGKVRLNLGGGIGAQDGGQFLPFVTLGSGIMRFDPNGLGETDNIYVTGGVGFTLSLQDRLTLSLGGDLLAYRYNLARTMLGQSGIDLLNQDLDAAGEPTLTVDDFDEETVISPSLNASVQFYLGGRRPGELSDLDRALMEQFSGGSGPALFLEPFYGRIEFNDALGLPKDQNVAGLNAGLQFSPYVGVNGFYWRGAAGDDVFDGFPGKFQDLAFYGGELNLRFGSQLGRQSFTPYVRAGAGYMDVLDEYGDDIPQAASIPDDRYFAIGGGGLEVPLTGSISLHGGIRYLLMSNADVADVSNPDQVYGSPMYTAGIQIDLGGGKRGRSVEEVLETRAEQRAARTRAEFIERDQAAQAEIERMRARIDSMEQMARRGMQEGDEAARAEIETLREEIAQLESRQEERAQELVTMREEEIQRLEQEARRAAGVDAPAAGERTSRRRSSESYLSGETVTLPVPEVGEIYVRIGESSEDVAVETVYGPPTVVQGGQAPTQRAQSGSRVSGSGVSGLTAEEIRDVVRAEIAQVEGNGGVLSAEQIRSVVEDVIEDEIRRSNSDAATLNMQRINNRLEEQAREIRRLRDELNDEVDRLQDRQQPSTSVVVDEEEGDGDSETTTTVVGLRRYQPNHFVPLAGYTVGDNNRFLIGVRGDYGETLTADVYDVRFAPELAVGFGDGLSLDIVANALVDLKFLQGILSDRVNPYVGAGLGITAETGFGINVLGGVGYQVGSGAVFGEFSTLDFLDYNRFLVGYRTRF